MRSCILPYQPCVWKRSSPVMHHPAPASPQERVRSSVTNSTMVERHHKARLPATHPLPFYSMMERKDGETALQHPKMQRTKEGTRVIRSCYVISSITHPLYYCYYYMQTCCHSDKALTPAVLTRRMILVGFWEQPVDGLVERLHSKA